MQIPILSATDVIFRELIKSKFVGSIDETTPVTAVSWCCWIRVQASTQED